MKRLRVGLLFGGESPEHEISIRSARSIAAGLDRDIYDLIPIGIDLDGEWHQIDGDHLLEITSLTPRLAKEIALQSDLLSRSFLRSAIDVAFPILHGPYGEDGMVQGALSLMGIPFVGSGLLGSAICMDKDVTKRLLRAAGLPTPRSLAFELDRVDTVRIEEVLGLPVIAKPARLGSSIGMTYVDSAAGLDEAIEAALCFDTKVIVEEVVRGREIECSVLGRRPPIASLPGEVVPKGAFYSYEAKYLDPDGAQLITPALLDDATVSAIQSMSIRAFEVLECKGMARVDFFLKENGELLINELNTIPGFTSISLYPKLWEVSGISYTKLLTELIQLALGEEKRASRMAPLTSIASPSYG